MLTERPPHRNCAPGYVANPVTLVDGREVLSDSPEWKHQCMAQHILDMPTKNDRLRLLSTLQEKYGLAHRAALQETIMALHKARQAAA